MLGCAVHGALGFVLSSPFIRTGRPGVAVAPGVGGPGPAPRECGVAATRPRVLLLRGGATMRASSDRDVLVIGAGVLGGLLVEQHKERFAEAAVIAETITTDKHPALQAKGAVCRTKDDPPIDPMPNVVFCAAPGKNPDYPGEVKKALAR